MGQAQDGWDVCKWHRDLFLGLAHIHELGLPVWQSQTFGCAHSSAVSVLKLIFLHVELLRGGGAVAIIFQHLQCRRILGDALNAVNDALHDAQ